MSKLFIVLGIIGLYIVIQKVSDYIKFIGDDNI